MIAIVASRDLWPTPNVVSAVAAAVMTEEEAAIRVSIDGIPASIVEQAVLMLCRNLHKNLTVYAPDMGKGRNGVYERDYHLVESCDRVLAFFSPGREMDGGTGHVVEAAMARGVKVEAFGLDSDGELELVGSLDGGIGGSP